MRPFDAAMEGTLGVPGIMQKQRIHFTGLGSFPEGRLTYSEKERVSRVEQCEWDSKGGERCEAL